MTVRDILLEILPQAKYLPSKNEIQSLCPFHNEDTPSFFVNLNLMVYHCFGCGASGSVSKLLSHLQVDMSLQLEITKEKKLTRKIKPIYLHQYPYPSVFTNQQALDYLISRHISLSTIKRYNLLYHKPYIIMPYYIPLVLYYYLLSPRPKIMLSQKQKIIAHFFKKMLIGETLTATNTATNNAIDKDIDDDYTIKDIKKTNNKITIFDKDILKKIKYLDRDLIYDSITDKHKIGVMGYTGRAARQIRRKTLYKSLNSNGLQRRLGLFGLVQIRDFRKRIFLVEGPFDVMRLSSEGLQAVGLLGKQLTREQRILLRFISPKKIAVALDGDAFQSAKKIFNLLKSDLPNTELELYKFPAKLDPGDLGRKVLKFRYTVRKYINDIIKLKDK